MNSPRVWVDENDLRIVIGIATLFRRDDIPLSDEMQKAIGRLLVQIDSPPPSPLRPYADREKALAAIASGWGREPTAAHPDCVCGKAKDGSGVPKGIARFIWDRRETYRPKECLVHKGGDA